MIYILEDDPSIRKLILYTLNKQGMEASGYEEPDGFWNAMKKDTPDLILLDIMLPKEDGITILKRLKASFATKDIPVIMITAKSSEYDKVLGLDEGADDYISKPFGMMELLARIKAVLRRSHAINTSILSIDGIEVDKAKHVVKIDGMTIALTKKEFELLATLMSRPGYCFTREYLLDTIWGYDEAYTSRTVDVHIRTLRSKLLDKGDVIETVRGVGYRIAERI